MSLDLAYKKSETLRVRTVLISALDSCTVLPRILLISVHISTWSNYRDKVSTVLMAWSIDILAGTIQMTFSPVIF